MERIIIELDVTKINKERIVDKEFTTKDGEVVKQKVYKMALVPLKEPKLITEGDNWKMYKKAFVVEEHTKEERDSGLEDVFLGDGIVFERADSSDDSVDSPF